MGARVNFVGGENFVNDGHGSKSLAKQKGVSSGQWLVGSEDKRERRQALCSSLFRRAVNMRPISSTKAAGLVSSGELNNPSRLPIGRWVSTLLRHPFAITKT